METKVVHTVVLGQQYSCNDPRDKRTVEITGWATGNYVIARNVASGRKTKIKVATLTTHWTLAARPGER